MVRGGGGGRGGLKAGRAEGSPIGRGHFPQVN